MTAAGAAPRRRHGQNFLLDDNLLRAIVRDADLSAGQHVLEVGPGPGLLSRHLLAAGVRVSAIEIDPAMERVASELVEPDLWKGLTWTLADAMGGGRRLGSELEALLPDVDALVANLPYGISAPLLAALACHPTPPRRQVVMLQREMGDRLVAGPGTKDYGPLAVIMALCARVSVLRRVPAQAFWPAPRVESVVVRLEVRADRPSPVELDCLTAFLPLAFHNRRKTLSNSLSESLGGAKFAAPVLSMFFLDENEKNSRAEAMPPVKLCALALRWAANAQGERHRPGVEHRPKD